MQAEFFGDFVQNLLSVDVSVNYPSYSYNLGFSAANPTIELAVSDLFSAGVKFETVAGISGVNLLSLTKSSRYMPANVESSDHSVKLAYRNGVFGAAKGYTLYTKNSMIFACFSKLPNVPAAAHPVHNSIKICREKIIDDHRLAITYNKFKKDVVGSVALNKLAPLATVVALGKKIMSRRAAVDLQNDVLKATEIQGQSNFTVKTTRDITIEVKNADRPLIFAAGLNNTLKASPDTTSIANDYDAAIVLKNGQSLISAGREIELKTGNDTGIKLSARDGDAISITTENNIKLSLTDNSIKLAADDANTLTFSDSAVKGMNDRMDCSNMQFKFAGNRFNAAGGHLESAIF